MAADPQLIRAALDQGLEAFNIANPVTIVKSDGTGNWYTSEPMDVANENARYDPQVGKPYQEAFLLPGTTTQPGNGVQGTTYDKGVYQVTLYYPRDEGAGDAAARAGLLRGYFDRSRLLTHGGITVSVRDTPSISPARTEPDWYKLVVSIPYYLYS
jgi:hypothetical protein